MLAKLGSLELIARAAVDGMVHGAHRTKRHGFSPEFAEYRDYAPGDDLRFIDWNAYARTDRLYLKRYEGETNTQLLLLVDASASMGVGEAPTKLDYATWLAAALALIAARQHDAAGLAAFNEELRWLAPPRSGAAHRQALLHGLDALTAVGGSHWRRAFAQVANRSSRRGIVVAISDFYCEAEDFGRALRLLGTRGHDLIAFHLLSAAERQPRLKAGRNTTLRDAETGSVLEVDAFEVRNVYPRRLAEHEAALRQAAGVAGADYVQMNTNQPLDEALIRYLRFRARRP